MQLNIKKDPEKRQALLWVGTSGAITRSSLEGILDQIYKEVSYLDLLDAGSESLTASLVPVAKVLQLPFMALSCLVLI